MRPLRLPAAALALGFLAVTTRAQSDEGSFAALRPSYNSDTAKALGLYRARRYREALRAAEGRADPAADFVRARALLALQRYGEAAPILRKLATREPLLADHFLARAARAELNAGDADAALRDATSVKEDTPVLMEAVLVAADASSSLGRHQDAKAHAERFLAKWPKAGGAAAALWIVARAHEQAGNRKAAREAKRRIAAEFPESSLAARVGEQGLSTTQLLARAEKLVSMHRNERATAELQRLLGRGLDKAQRCKATYLLGAANQRLRRHKAAFAALRKAANLCKGDKLGARAMYLWGKGLLNGPGAAGAARILERLATNYPQHRLADDALVLAALGWKRAGNITKARAALERLLREVGAGDMAPKARFDLARIEARAGDKNAAKKRLLAMAQDDPYPDDATLRGRPLYELGKLETKTGNMAGANEAWQRCVREHPHTFWATLARGHLRAAGVATGDDEAAPPGAPTPDAVPWPAFPDALTQSRAFLRAAALIRLGAGDLAGGEVKLAAKDAGSTAEARAALSLLYYFAGDWHRSHRIVRWQMKDALARPPTPQSRRFFLLGFPRGYFDIIEREAKKQRIDPLLLVALVREESAFNPTIESWANAVGLGQFIWPTARRMAQVLRIPGFHRGMLIDPEINLRLAAKYLSNLLRRFKGAAPLAVSSYNAGELATERWLSARANVPLDEFIDAIPYEQTRHYTRRVMESYATYRYLYAEGKLRYLALGPRHARQRGGRPDNRAHPRRNSKVAPRPPSDEPRDE